MVAVVASTEEEFFQSYGFKGTENTSTRQAPEVSPFLGEGNWVLESLSMGWTVMSHEKQPISLSSPLSSLWLERPQNFLLDCIPPSTLKC